MLQVWNLSHVSLVVAADLLDADVIFGLDVGLGGGVGPGQSHHTGDVLEVLLVFNFNLWERRHRLVWGVLQSVLSKPAAVAQTPTGMSHLCRSWVMKGPWMETMPLSVSIELLDCKHGLRENDAVATNQHKTRLLRNDSGRWLSSTLSHHQTCKKDRSS